MKVRGGLIKMKLYPAKAETWVTCSENRNLSEVVKRHGRWQILLLLQIPKTGKKVGHGIERQRYEFQIGRHRPRLLKMCIRPPSWRK
jgi:hypothetical protein